MEFSRKRDESDEGRAFSKMVSQESRMLRPGRVNARMTSNSSRPMVACGWTHVAECLLLIHDFEIVIGIDEPVLRFLGRSIAWFFCCNRGVNLRNEVQKPRSLVGLLTET
jgi:hypothetical protein